MELKIKIQVSLGFYIENDKKINNMEDLVNGFNKFYVNVGQDLAEIINNPETTEGVDADL